jgi:hypothetical protein
LDNKLNPPDEFMADVMDLLKDEAIFGDDKD